MEKRVFCCTFVKVRINYKIGLCFILFTLFGKAQNLVPNSSFEDTVSCPNAPNQLNRTQLWINPTQGTPEYYNACSSNIGVDIPANGQGTQMPKSGQAYCGIYAFQKGTNSAREYLEVALTNTLTINHKYLISFNVSLADYSQYAISSIGALLSATLITGAGTTPLPYVPQVENSTLLNDTASWTLIQDTIVSNGTEQYITIGNFRNDANSDTTFLWYFSTWNAAYYFVDDVSVMDVLDLGIHDLFKNQVKVFPNPANSILTLEAKIQDADLTILDLLGNEIIKARFSNKASLDVRNLKSGIYLLRINSKDRTIASRFVRE